MEKIEDEHHFILECPAYHQLRRDSPIQFENYSSPEAIFHLEDPPVLAEFLRQAYNQRDQLTAVEPEICKVVDKSEDGLKLYLCKWKDTPGQLKVKNITKDGTRLKIYRTSTTTPFGNLLLRKHEQASDKYLVGLLMINLPSIGIAGNRHPLGSPSLGET